MSNIWVKLLETCLCQLKRSDSKSESKVKLNIVISKFSKSTIISLKDSRTSTTDHWVSGLFKGDWSRIGRNQNSREIVEAKCRFMPALERRAALSNALVPLWSSNNVRPLVNTDAHMPRQTRPTKAANARCPSNQMRIGSDRTNSHFFLRLSKICAVLCSPKKIRLLWPHTSNYFRAHVGGL